MNQRQPEGWEEDVSRVHEAHIIEKSETRQRVVMRASSVIDALTDKVDGVIAVSMLGSEFSDAPDEVPKVEWHSTLAMPEGREDLIMPIIGSVGEYYAHRFPNERPSATFNSGFYAAVLAVKAGLIDPEAFHHDSETR